MTDFVLVCLKVSWKIGHSNIVATKKENKKEKTSTNSGILFYSDSAMKSLQVSEHCYNHANIQLFPPCFRLPIDFICMIQRDMKHAPVWISPRLFFFVFIYFQQNNKNCIFSRGFILFLFNYLLTSYTENPVVTIYIYVGRSSEVTDK